MNEVELKFLDINVEEIKEKLKKIGAKLKSDALTESYSFFAEGFHGNNSEMKYLRVRKTNDDIRITYKDPVKSSGMTVREEIEIKVDNFEVAINLLEKLNFKKNDIFRKHRIHYELGDVHFEIDTLDNVPTYLEIETTTEESMKKICSDLGLNIAEGKNGTIVEILPELF